MKEVGGRTITTKAVPLVDFAQSFNAINNDKAPYMHSFGIPLYSGMDLDDDKRSQFEGGGSISANLEKVANLDDPDIVDAIKAAKGKGAKQTIPTFDTDQYAGYTGNTESRKPIHLEAYRDLSAPQGRQEMVTATIDMRALASANDAERNKNRSERGMAPLSKAAMDRLNVTVTASTTDHGVAGMSANNFNRNLTLMTAQNHLMTAAKGNDKRPTTPPAPASAIKSVGDMYVSAFSKFTAACEDKPFKGVPKMEKGADGKYTPSKKETIPGTEFKSLKDLGYARHVDPDTQSVSLVCIDGAKAGSKEGRDGIKAFNAAFNNYMSQQVNAQFPKGSDELKIGSAIKVQCYPVNPPLPTDNMGTVITKDSTPPMTLLQPQLSMDINAYSGSVTKCVECAVHQNTTPVETLYGKDVLDNVRKIQASAPEKDSDERVARFDKIADDMSKRGLTPEVIVKEDGPKF